MIFNTDYAYGSVAKFFHWFIFILVLIMISGGFFMEDVPEDYKGLIYNLHKLTGVAILTLMLLRLLWRMVNVKPKLPADMPEWQRKSVRRVHELLYLLIIAMPLAGWIGSSAAGRPPHIGDWQLMLPIPQDKAIVESSFAMHEYLAWAIIIFGSLHILAALYHHFIRRDDILRRML